VPPGTKLFTYPRITSRTSYRDVLISHLALPLRPSDCQTVMGWQRKLVEWSMGGTSSGHDIVPVDSPGYRSRRAIPSEPAIDGPLQVGLVSGVTSQRYRQYGGGLLVRPSPTGYNGPLMQYSSYDVQMTPRSSQQTNAANQSRSRAPPANIVLTSRPEQYTVGPTARQAGLRSAYSELDLVEAEIESQEQLAKEISKAAKEYRRVTERDAAAEQKAYHADRSLRQWQQELR